MAEYYDKKLYEVRKPADLSNLPSIKGYDFELEFDYSP